MNDMILSACTMQPEIAGSVNSDPQYILTVMEGDCDGAVCGGAVPVSLQTAAEQNSGITVPGENQGRTDPGALADPLPARTDSDTGDGCRCKDSYRVDGK